MSMSLISRALAKEKDGKSPGQDEIRSEMIKALGEVGIDWLELLFNKMYIEKKVPNDFLKLVLIPIPKKGDLRKCGNYRGISLISIVAKCYARVLEMLLRMQISKLIEEFQHGFMKEKGTNDCTFIIKQVIEKCIEFEEMLCITFVDLEKAYDFVDRAKVWQALLELGVDLDLIDNIKALYRDSIATVRISGECSKPFRVELGLRQGCPLSPLLFIAVFNKVCQEIKYSKTGIPLTQEEWLMLLAFADDTALISKALQEMQLLLDIFSEACKELGLKINVDKTKYMIINETELGGNHNLTCYGKTVEKVKEFTYLGSILTADGKSSVDVSERVSKACKAFGALKKYIFRNHFLPVKSKMKCIRSIIEPTAMFGSEGWTLSNDDIRRLNVAQMTWLRNILGVTKFDRLRNEYILKKCETEKLSTRIARGQLRWYGHIVRMEPHRLTKKVFSWKVPKEWKRPVGRPQLRWKENILDSLKNLNISDFREAEELAQDRNRWRGKIHNLKN